MLLYYSGGLFGVHNVEAGNPEVSSGYLGLSNTSFSKKTLSFLKPPHDESSFAAFSTVLDESGFPGKGREEPFRVPSVTFPRGSVRFRQKRPPTGPGGPVPIQP